MNIKIYILKNINIIHSVLKKKKEKKNIIFLSLSKKSIREQTRKRIYIDLKEHQNSHKHTHTHTLIYFCVESKKKKFLDHT